MRALISGLVHESSTMTREFADPTGAADFAVHVGADLVDRLTGTNTVPGGYLAACHEAGVEVVPGLHARAEPGPVVARDAYAALERRLVAAATAAGPVDVVLLDLHGAGTLDDDSSLDLAVLRAVRAAVGPGVPVAATLDLHANTPAGLVAHGAVPEGSPVDVVVGYQEYPHTDVAARARVAADVLIRGARGEVRPVTRALRLPMVLPPSTTTAGPAATARDLVRAAETRAGVLACTLLHGFPFADTAQAATRVVTVTDGDPALADAVNADVARWLWTHRAEFATVAVPPGAAIDDGLRRSARPVVIGDGTDNPGSGAPGDSTYLLRALLDRGVQACLATLHDPGTVTAAITAGVGARLEVALGGRHGWASGDPVRGTAEVRAVTDGRTVATAMNAGRVVDFGPSAWLRLGTVDVVVSTHRRQVLDPGVLLLHGIDPAAYDVVAVKSIHHFRAGFAHLAGTLLVTDAPGPLTRAIADVPRPGPTGRLWPLDPATTFDLPGSTP